MHTEFETAEGAEDFAEECKGFPLRSFAKTFASSAFDLLSAATQPVESYSGFVFYCWDQSDPRNHTNELITLLTQPLQTTLFN